jgi:chemotaxis protein MotB
MSRAISFLALIGFSLGSVGCMVPKSRLDACYAYNCQLQRRNQEVCAQYENLRHQNADLANKNLDLEDQLAAQEQLIAGYEQRRAEWGRELDDLRSRAASLGEVQSPLPPRVQRKLEEFANRYPEFVEVDPVTGISKFRSDVLFDSGEATLRQEAYGALHDFARIFQDPSGQSLLIAVVGHTDVHQIKKPQTAARFETNWDLSTARANAVVKNLQQTGITPNRMVSVGYGPYQPLSQGMSADALARNRRVEIYVLSPDAPMVGRTERSTQY